MTAGDVASQASDSGGAALAKPRTNTLAIVALVASVVSLFGIGSLIGVALGVVALNQISLSGERGRGLAYASVFVGAVTLLISMILVVMGLTTW